MGTYLGTVVTVVITKTAKSGTENNPVEKSLRMTAMSCCSIFFLVLNPVQQQRMP